MSRSHFYISYPSSKDFLTWKAITDSVSPSNDSLVGNHNSLQRIILFHYLPDLLALGLIPLIYSLARVHSIQFTFQTAFESSISGLRAVIQRCSVVEYKNALPLQLDATFSILSIIPHRTSLPRNGCPLALGFSSSHIRSVHVFSCLLFSFLFLYTPECRGGILLYTSCLTIDIYR